MTNTNNIALANGFAPLTTPAANVIADGILAAINGTIDATRWLAQRLRPVMASDATLAPHAAIVMEPARFILGR